MIQVLIPLQDLKIVPAFSILMLFSNYPDKEKLLPTSSKRKLANSQTALQPWIYPVCKKSNKIWC